MNIEAIVLYVFSVMFGLLIVCVAYGVVRYLNKKALGMQTMVDQMVKDIIYLSVFFEIIHCIIIIVQLTRPLSHYMAVLFTLVILFLRLSGLCQLSMIFLVRYLYVFHYANLNMVDEKLMKRITRCSVGILSTILLLMAMSNVENTILYQHFTDGDSIPVLNPVLALTVFISLVIIIIIQFKIEMFKKSVDTKQFDQLESGEDQFGNCQYLKLETYRIEVLILVFGILFTLSLYWSINTGEDLNLIKAIVSARFLQLVFTLICIKRSEKMFSFFKNQIIIWFCCHQRTNGGIIANSNNQWQETYVNDSLDQNEDQNTNDNHLGQGEVGGKTGNEIALQRIS